MRILFLWDADYPWDIRVEKVTNALLEAGHDVHMVCRNLKGQPRTGMVGRLVIHRLPAFGGAPSWLRHTASFPFFLNPVWVSEVFRHARSLRVDMVMIRDLPLAPLGVMCAQRLGVPAVLDMAEAYPEMLRNAWRFGGWRPINVLVRNPYLAEWVERWVLKRIDHVLVMVDESRDRLIAKGVAPNRIAIVSNTPDVARFQEFRKKRTDAVFVLTYLGLLGHSRGLDVALQGLRRYIDRYGTNVRFQIIGSGKAERKLRKLSSRLGLGNYVEFLGWVDNRDVPPLIAESDACIVPHRYCGHWNHTIPNKLFDYMAAGRAVLVSDVVPMRRIVGDTGCGLVYQEDDPDDLAAKLNMLQDPTLRERLGRNGLHAVRSSYNWDYDRRALLVVVEGLSGAAV